MTQSNVKIITIKPATHAALTRLCGRLAARTGKRVTHDQMLNNLLDLVGCRTALSNLISEMAGKETDVVISKAVSDQVEEACSISGWVALMEQGEAE